MISLLETHEQDDDFSSLTAPEIQHNEAIDSATESTTSPLYGCFDPSQCEHDYDLALDLGITRKQLSSHDGTVNKMSTDNYIKLVRSLNEKQMTFFHNILHMTKTEQFPYYVFLTGGAVSGKAY